MNKKDIIVQVIKDYKGLSKLDLDKTFESYKLEPTDILLIVSECEYELGEICKGNFFDCKTPSDLIFYLTSEI